MLSLHQKYAFGFELFMCGWSIHAKMVSELFEGNHACFWTVTIHLRERKNGGDWNTSSLIQAHFSGWIIKRKEKSTMDKFHESLAM